MASKRSTVKDPDLAKVGVALKRAAAKARQLGFDTNTPVYVFRDGKIVDVIAEQRTARSSKGTTAKSSQRTTDSHRRKVPSKKIR